MSNQRSNLKRAVVQFVPPRQQPAQTFRCGNVRTRVWANPRDNGRVHWRVDQLYLGEFGPIKSFPYEAIRHQVDGLRRARRWVRLMNRLHFWRRVFFRI